MKKFIIIYMEKYFDIINDFEFWFPKLNEFSPKIIYFLYKS